MEKVRWNIRGIYSDYKEKIELIAKDSGYRYTNDFLNDLFQKVIDDKGIEQSSELVSRVTNAQIREFQETQKDILTLNDGINKLVPELFKIQVQNAEMISMLNILLYGADGISIP